MNSARLATALLLALAMPTPAVAMAQEAIPPGNSGVNQYRETLPAPDGGRPTVDTRPRSPSRVLGERDAKRLESYGADGRAAAELAAATAPIVAVVEERTGNGSRGSAAEVIEEVRPGLPGGSPASPDAPVQAELTSASSPLGEVLGQATGVSSSGGIGVWLPLVLLLATGVAAGYALARRRARG